MKPFFSTADRRLALQLAAHSWAGTPFRAQSHVKGAGVDCVWLAASLYMECGHLKEFRPGPYHVQPGQDLVAGWLKHDSHFLHVETPAVGDLLCFRIGKYVHHVGVMLGDIGFVHVLSGYTVRTSRLDDSTWTKRLAAVYRPIEP